jgi:hypothetical protein
MCPHARMLLTAVDEAVQIAYALGSVNGQYTLMCESAYSRFLEPNMPRAVMESFFAVNHHMSRELLEFFTNNPVLDFRVEQRGPTGQYTLSGPSLRLDYHNNPCLGKYCFDISHVLLDFKNGGHNM